MCFTVNTTAWSNSVAHYFRKDVVAGFKLFLMVFWLLVMDFVAASVHWIAVYVLFPFRNVLSDD